MIGSLSRKTATCSLIEGKICVQENKLTVFFLSIHRVQKIKAVLLHFYLEKGK